MVVAMLAAAGAEVQAQEVEVENHSPRRLMLAFSYSPAITQRGHGLQRVTEPALIGDPFRGYYILHTLGIEIGYFVTPRWSIEIGRKWFYGRMDDSRKVATQIKPSGEGGWLYRNLYWLLSSNVYAIAVSFHSKEELFVTCGGEFYYSTGHVHNVAHRWDEGLNQDVERFIDASNEGRGYGFFAQTGWRRQIASTIRWGLSFGARIGKSLEREYSVPEDIIWNGPVDHSFSGIFTKFELDLLFF